MCLFKLIIFFLIAVLKVSGRGNYKKHGRSNTIKTSFGTPVDDLTNSLTAGAIGPTLLQDITTYDAIINYVTQRTPQRAMTATAVGASGYFEVTNDIRRFCKAAIFSKIGKRTRMAIRISITGSDVGNPDTMRNVRAFGMKFYTEEGNWDLLGASAWRFHINDGLVFMNNIHALGKNPVTNCQDPNMYWDFMTIQEQAIADIIMQFSYMTLPDGFRHIDGHSLNTYKMVNHKGVAVYVRFHWKTNQGVKYLSTQRAANLSATDPEYAANDFYNAIDEKNFPSWTLMIQVMTFREAEEYEYNPFYPGKFWPEDKFPMIEVGVIVLNKLPKNYFADVEQIALSPSNMVPGIEPSPDRMLQVRLMAYKIAQIYRLGVNYNQLPINRPLHKVKNYQRNGASVIYNQGEAPNYYPSSLKGPDVDPYSAPSTFYVSGDVARHNSTNQDNFPQATLIWNSMNESNKTDLVNNLVGSLCGAYDFLQKRALSQFRRVDIDFAKRVQFALKNNRCNALQ